MSCQRCGSERILKVSGKCCDSFYCIDAKSGREFDGYVPSSPVGSGDYIELSYCQDCGQIQGEFPSDIFKEMDDEQKENRDES